MKQETSFTNKLNRPYYLETSAGKRWMSCLRTASFVFVFLVVFQPFGLSSLPHGIVRIALGYGLTTFIVMALLNILCIPLFPRYFSEDKWNVLRELYWNLINVMLIGLANALYSAFIGMAPFTPYAILIFELYTVTIAVFPIAITVFLKETVLKKKFEKDSAQLNSVIEEHKHENKESMDDPEFAIFSENKKEKLQSRVQDLIYIQSSDNYIEIHYAEGNKVSKKLLRNSLKTVALDLADHKQFFRCHKSYLINVNRVKHVSGNAQGYKLHLIGSDILVPVSRQYNDTVRERLNL